MARGAGPFSVGKPTDIHSNGEDYDVIELFDGEAKLFAVVFAQDCFGKSIAAAKARATRIAESLNKTEGHS